jgi:hypothetical protein
MIMYDKEIISQTYHNHEIRLYRLQIYRNRDLAQISRCKYIGGAQRAAHNQFSKRDKQIFKIL